MQLPRRILIAVAGDRSPRRMLDRAISIARRTGASLDIFHAIADPVVTLAVRGRGAKRGVDAAMEAQTKRRMQRLEKLAAAVRAGGIPCTASCSWDYPAHEAIVRHARKTRADLVVVESQRHRFGANLFMAHTDWELIRTCEIPLLIVRQSGEYKRPTIVAALDPSHQNAKPAALDRRLVAAGARLAGALDGELHVMHAYLPFSFLAPASPAVPVMGWIPPEEIEHHHEHLVKAVAREARPAKVPPARQHVLVGDTVDELVRLVRAQRASLVVMGAVSRSGLKRLLIGNTAQRALNRLPCDVLVIKPAGFVSPVPATPRKTRT